MHTVGYRQLLLMLQVVLTGCIWLLHVSKQCCTQQQNCLRQHSIVTVALMLYTIVIPRQCRCTDATFTQTLLIEWGRHSGSRYSKHCLQLLQQHLLTVTSLLKATWVLPQSYCTWAILWYCLIIYTTITENLTTVLQPALRYYFVLVALSAYR